MCKIQSSRRTFIQSALLSGTAAATATFTPSPIAQAETSSPPAGAGPRVVAHTNSDIVETVYGKVRGLERNGIKTFRGIPYGADAGGKNRFLPAEPPAPWTGVRSALWYGPASPWWQGRRPEWSQDERMFVLQLEDGQEDEDLLKVNIWTPGVNDNRKRPVFVFVHGGGFTWGSGFELPNYDGENLSRRGDIVVVNFMHRLSTFGFLNLSDIDSRYAATGNLGMADIVFLLQWVRDNIANFGGDPGNVTIAGQSGGGGKVSCLLTMPSAHGLFHKACIHSGSTLKIAEKEQSLSLSAAILKQLGINKENSNRLQEITTRELLTAAQAALAGRGRGGGGFGPCVDGVVIPRHPFDPDAPEISADIPMMVGNTLNEMGDALDKPDAFSMTADELTARLKPAHGERTAEIISVFRKAHPKANDFQLFSIIQAMGPSGVSRTASITQSQRKAAQGKAPVYNWWWQWQTPILDGRPMALHSGDLAFFFDNTERCQNLTGNGPEARDLAAKMSEAWIHFARTGNPNHPAIPKWSPVTPTGSETMIFDSTCVFSKDPDSEQRKILETHPA